MRHNARPRQIDLGPHSIAERLPTGTKISGARGTIGERTFAAGEPEGFEPHSAPRAGQTRAPVGGAYSIALTIMVSGRPLRAAPLHQGVGQHHV